MSLTKQSKAIRAALAELSKKPPVPSESVRVRWYTKHPMVPEYRGDRRLYYSLVVRRFVCRVVGHHSYYNGEDGWLLAVGLRTPDWDAAKQLIVCWICGFRRMKDKKYWQTVTGA